MTREPRSSRRRPSRAAPSARSRSKWASTRRRTRRRWTCAGWRRGTYSAKPRAAGPWTAPAPRAWRFVALSLVRDRNCMDQLDLPVAVLTTEQDRGGRRDGLFLPVNAVRLIEHERDQTNFAPHQFLRVADLRVHV